MLEATWEPKTKSWIQPEPLNKDYACTRCIGGSLLRDCTGTVTCINCGFTPRLVLPRRGAARDMAKKPLAPERPEQLEEQVAA